MSISLVGLGDLDQFCRHGDIFGCRLDITFSAAWEDGAVAAVMDSASAVMALRRCISVGVLRVGECQVIVPGDFAEIFQPIIRWYLIMARLQIHCQVRR